MALNIGAFCLIWTGLFCFSVDSSVTGEVRRDFYNDTSSDSPVGLLTLSASDPFFLFMDHSQTFQVTYTVLCEKLDQEYFVVVKSYDENVLSVGQQSVHTISCQNSTYILRNSTNTRNISSVGSVTESTVSDVTTLRNTYRGVFGNLSFVLYGELLGRTFLGIGIIKESRGNISISFPDNGTSAEIQIFPVTIFRKQRIVDTVFRVVIYFFLIYSTLGFGCKLDLKVVKENLKKPVAPCIGLGCQYIMMPLIAFAIAKAVTKYSDAISLGIFIAGCCPGGGVSNIYSYLLGGDLSLSITMTSLSSLAAVAMLPLWVYTLGSVFVAEDANVEIPFLNIFTTLLILILPLIVGVFIKYKLPKIAKGLTKSMTPVTVIAITLLLTVGIYSNLYIFKLFNPRIILAGCLLPYFGYALSMIISAILRRPWTIIKTIAIETGIQNTGIAMIIMLFAFPPPDGELAAIAPIASAVMTPLPLFVITIFYLIYKKCNKKKYKSVKTEKNDTEKDDVRLEKRDMKYKSENGHGDDAEGDLIQN